MRPAVKVARIAGASRHSRLATEPIINPDQTSYIKNWYIGENVRLISDFMMYTEENNMPGVALFIDFRKTFDTNEWDFINNCLKKFNFGPDIQNWVKILHNKVCSCVLNNGSASEFFPEVLDKVVLCQDYYS